VKLKAQCCKLANIWVSILVQRNVFAPAEAISFSPAYTDHIFGSVYVAINLELVKKLKAFK
jgi:hypothetical protein